MKNIQFSILKTIDCKKCHRVRCLWISHFCDQHPRTWRAAAKQQLFWLHCCSVPYPSEKNRTTCCKQGKVFTQSTVFSTDAVNCFVTFCSADRELCNLQLQCLKEIYHSANGLIPYLCQIKIIVLIICYHGYHEDIAVH